MKTSPLESIRRLRLAGYDVRAVIEESPGAKDRELLIRAAEESRIVLTFDRDYGELVYRQLSSNPSRYCVLSVSLQHIRLSQPTIFLGC